eukprot:TRINITY_DN42452_c0_g1_i1.p1 TRINITY_DN42452_c0_g1~~TRINITY_DN42452_c0_g1_i1.p1  ORF type:complete len:711 (+),score=121.51 TRINITY_DN42452_c0_g1_i1:13-2145(+)
MDDVIVNCFKRFDTNGDNAITYEELASVLQKLDQSHWTNDRVARLLDVIDTSNDGRISLIELASWITYTDDRRALHDMFELPAQTHEEQPKLSTTRARLADLLARIDDIFVSFAGEDAVLDFDDMKRLAVALSDYMRLDVSIFGRLNDIFYSFDFTGDGVLDSTEGIMMIEDMLRTYIDMVEPVGVGHVDFSRLDVQTKDCDYIIRGSCGAGSYGSVELAVHKATGKQRVVKTLVKERTRIGNIEREFKLLKDLDHPKVARVFDAFQDSLNFYVVGEPYYGGNLWSLFDKAKQHEVTVTADYLGDLFRQMLEAVAYLHSRHIRHSDLKEANVMIARDDPESWRHPDIVVIDFGFASHISRDSPVGGTPGYCPPEFYTDDMLTPKGDIHALGVIIYQMCTGLSAFPKSPKDGEQYPSCYSTVNTLPDCSMLAKRPYGNGLDQLVLQMLEKAFKKRPSAQKCLDQQFFKSLSGSCMEIPDAVMQAFDQLHSKTKLARAIISDLVESQNLAHLSHLNRFFSAIDSDHNGVISVDEAHQKLSDLMPADMVERVIEALICTDGLVTYKEFMGHMLTASKSWLGNVLSKEFEDLDKDRTGSLSPSELTELMQRPALAGYFSGGQEVDTLLAELDMDSDGSVSFEEFERALVGQQKVLSARPYQLGDSLEYSSARDGSWIPCAVVSVHPCGALEIDIKPGVWLDKHTALNKLRLPNN